MLVPDLVDRFHQIVCLFATCSCDRRDVRIFEMGTLVLGSYKNHGNAPRNDATNQNALYFGVIGNHFAVQIDFEVFGASSFNLSGCRRQAWSIATAYEVENCSLSYRSLISYYRADTRDLKSTNGLSPGRFTVRNVETYQRRALGTQVDSIRSDRWAPPISIMRDVSTIEMLRNWNSGSRTPQAPERCNENKNIVVSKNDLLVKTYQRTNPAQKIVQIPRLSSEVRILTAAATAARSTLSKRKRRASQGDDRCID